MHHFIFSLFLSFTFLAIGIAIGRGLEAYRWARNAYTYTRVEHQGKLYKVTEA